MTIIRRFMEESFSAYQIFTKSEIYGHLNVPADQHIKPIVPLNANMSKLGLKGINGSSGMGLQFISRQMIDPKSAARPTGAPTTQSLAVFKRKQK